jgi:SOUL heme-binding protein
MAYARINMGWRMANHLVLALESALAVFGIRSLYEYDVIERIGEVEIRAYGPRLAAETTVAAANEEAGRNEAFRILAGYISGGNLEQVNIAMTTPVATGAAAASGPGGSPAAARAIPMTVPVEKRVGRNIAHGDCRRAGGVSMRFFLPGKVTQDTPRPNDDARVKIVQIPEETIAALTFAGRGNEAALAEKKRALLAALADSLWRAAEEPYTLFYDPPFTISFLRRNEVAVRVIATRGYSFGRDSRPGR